MVYINYNFSAAMSSFFAYLWVLNLLAFIILSGVFRHDAKMKI